MRGESVYRGCHFEPNFDTFVEYIFSNFKIHSLENFHQPLHDSGWARLEQKLELFSKKKLNTLFFNRFHEGALSRKKFRKTKIWNRFPWCNRRFNGLWHLPLSTKTRRRPHPISKYEEKWKNRDFSKRLEISSNNFWMICEQEQPKVDRGSSYPLGKNRVFSTFPHTFWNGVWSAPGPRSIGATLSTVNWLEHTENRL
jgi:hypothetical protein